MKKEQKADNSHKEHEEMVAAGEPFSPEMEEPTPKQSDSEEDEGSRLRRELGESQDKLLRLYSEFDNFRKRSARERSELLKSAGEATISSLLPVLDDFERAINAIQNTESNTTAFEGVVLIQNKLNAILEQKGLKKMISVGEEFNPDFHEAISIVAANDTKQHDIIIDEAECGYLLNGKVIRHAKVIVAK
ncbi:MAG TPA: nucleotide exchange factor GrpE [Bacteroidia bacterium]|nr:nucleotide exchange factor GrpE [Bacteroidia bacterium]